MLLAPPNFSDTGGRLGGTSCCTGVPLIKALRMTPPGCHLLSALLACCDKSASLSGFCGHAPPIIA
jgi:hypothetical protein